MRKSTKSARSNSIKRVQIAISGENHVRMLRSRINFIANLPSLTRRQSFGSPTPAAAAVMITACQHIRYKASRARSPEPHLFACVQLGTMACALGNNYSACSGSTLVAT